MNNKFQITTLIGLFLLFVTVSGGYAADAKLESEIQLAEGPFPYIEKARLGRPEIFWNLLEEDIKCYPLIVDGRQVDYIYHARKTKYSIVMHRCTRGKLTKGDTFEMKEAPKGAVYGFSESKSYQLKKRSGKWILAKLELPGYGIFSYDSFCGDYVAYWAYVKDIYCTYVYDIKQRQLIYSKEIGAENFGTDDPWAFGQPKWDTSCQAVVFPKNFYLKSKLKFDFKNK